MGSLTWFHMVFTYAAWHIGSNKMTLFLIGVIPPVIGGLLASSRRQELLLRSPRIREAHRLAMLDWLPLLDSVT